MEKIMDIQSNSVASADAGVLISGEIGPESSQPDWVIGLNVHVVDFLSGYTVTGVLMNFTPGEVTVSVDEIIPEQRSVTVQFDSFVFEGETLFCRAKGHGYEAHITIGDVENSGLRKEPRFPIELAGRMFRPNADPVPITIVDFSTEGLGIELPVGLQVDQPIAILTGPVFVFAIVRHCRNMDGGGYRAGVEMQHVLARPMETAVDEEEAPSLLGRVFGKRQPVKSTPLRTSNSGKSWRARRDPSQVGVGASW
jgi:hypothetical protein